MLKVVNRLNYSDKNDLSIHRILYSLRLKAANKRKKLGPVAKLRGFINNFSKRAIGFCRQANDLNRSSL